MSARTVARNNASPAGPARVSLWLRDEVDLDTLAGELRGVVGETMQPAHVTLRLRRTRA